MILRRAEIYRRSFEVVGMLHKGRGCRFVAGTDTPAGVHIFPGFSLHEELQRFVAAGFTPVEALQTATLNPARFFGMEVQLGASKKGKLGRSRAFLKANPLDDIAIRRRSPPSSSIGSYFFQQRSGKDASPGSKPPPPPALSPSSDSTKDTRADARLSCRSGPQSSAAALTLPPIPPKIEKSTVMGVERPSSLFAVDCGCTAACLNRKVKRIVMTDML